MPGWGKNTLLHADRKVVCLNSIICIECSIAPAANAYTIAGALNGMDKRIWIVQAQGIPSIATGEPASLRLPCC